MNIFSLNFAKQLILPLTSVLLLAGCSTLENSHRQKSAMMTAYQAGNQNAVLEEINAKLNSTSGSGDEVMWHLESGSANFIFGKYADSIRQFDQAEKLISAYDKRAVISAMDVGSEGAMLITNLNALPYRGFCRDRIMLPVFRGFAYLGKGDEDGFRTEMFRLRQNQQQVQTDYRKFFEAESRNLERSRQKNQSAAKLAADNQQKLLNNPNNAQNQSLNAAWAESRQVAHKGYGNFLNPFAIFLSGISYLRDNDYENAYVDFDRLYQAMPQNVLAQSYMATILKLTKREVPEALKNVKPINFPLDKNTVTVILANGRSAAFRQEALYFPIMTAWSVCEYYPAPFQSARIRYNNQVFSTIPLADMDGIISQEYQERLPGMITRIFLSTAIKEGGKYAASYAAYQSDELVGLLVLLAGSAYTAAMNTADTRSWEILPKEFQVLQLPMPENHQLDISLSGNNFQTVQIPPAARSAFIYINAPSPHNWSYQIFPFYQK